MFCLIYLTSDKYYKVPQSYTLCIALLSIVLLLLFENKQGLVEHLQISGEAVQNVGSIFNSNQMVVKDLRVTGNLDVDQMLTAKKDVKINGDLEARHLTTNGNVITKGTLSVTNDLACGPLSVNGTITGNNSVNVPNVNTNRITLKNLWEIDPIGVDRLRFRRIGVPTPFTIRDSGDVWYINGLSYSGNNYNTQWVNGYI
jgi:cytoskeletal protein CcmA (bactofilin family)